VGEVAAPGWRRIDELAQLVGGYAWTEHRIFEVSGAWATAPEDEPTGTGTAAGLRVWCAAASRRHGALAAAWATHLPVRAGVDARALIAAPSDDLAEAFDALGALPAGEGGPATLAEAVLPGLERLYGRHLAGASPVSEGPVIEELVRARQVLAGEGDEFVLPPGMHPGFSADPLLRTTFEQAFEEICVFPAVRAS
jgi:hypothetical protein